MKKLTLILVALLFIGTTDTFAQNGGDQVEPPYGLSELEAYSLFVTDFQNESYKSALNNGRWILKNMQKSIEGYNRYDLATNLDRFITIYEELAAQSTDPSLKSAYVDSANLIYDKVFDNFSQEEIDYVQWHINHGRLYQNNADYIDSAEVKAAEQYRKAYNLNPEEMTTTADGYYIKWLLNHLVSQDTEASKQEALGIIKKVESNAVENLKSYFDKIRDKLFDSPEERMTFLEGKLEENPEDLEVLRELRNIYENQDMVQKAQELNQKLYEMNPSYQNVTSLANTAIQNGNYKEAIKYLDEAKDKTEKPDQLKSIYMSLSTAHLNLGNLQQVRSTARKALEIDSSLGQAYINIADAYAQAVRNCTSGRELKRQDRAVYWLVLDYLNQAKQADSSVTGAANSRAQTFRQAAPTSEAIFMTSDWNTGDSIRIDGSLNSCYSWINESTTIREF